MTRLLFASPPFFLFPTDFLPLEPSEEALRTTIYLAYFMRGLRQVILGLAVICHMTWQMSLARIKLRLEIACELEITKLGTSVGFGSLTEDVPPSDFIHILPGFYISILYKESLVTKTTCFCYLFWN